MSAEPQLRIAALGVTVLERGGEQLEGRWLARRPGQLLKFLIARRGAPASVEEIAEGLWPGAAVAAAANVRYYVHVLRRTLDPDGAPGASPVRCAAGGYALDMAGVALDADEFERALQRGELEAALELYRGEFLADEPYACWAQAERQRLHELACEALRELALGRLERGELHGAHESLARLAAMAPYDEDVHRKLIELDLLRGRRSDALRRYEALRRRLREAFEEEPSFTPASLAHGLSARPALAAL
jgi:DNA-binding SARP family transcriptional activator